MPSSFLHSLGCLLLLFQVEADLEKSDAERRSLEQRLASLQKRVTYNLYTSTIILIAHPSAVTVLAC